MADFTKAGGLFADYQLPEPNKYITQEFQDYGYRLAAELNDLAHKSLYIKMAKTVERGILERARSFVSDAQAESKAKLFMWKVKEIRAELAQKKMSKSSIVVIIALLVVAVATGYNYFFQPFATLPQPTVTAAPAPSPTLTPAQAQLVALSPRERVVQLLAVPIEVPATGTSTSTSSAGLSSTATTTWLASNHPGAVVLFGNRISTASATQVIRQIDASSRLPIWIAVDHEGGSVQRLAGAGFTRLPSWQSFCNQEEEQQTAWLASASAELKQVGVDLVLGPVIDVASGSAVLSSRVCSGEYEKVAQEALEYVEIFTAMGIQPVIKHFPGIGAANRDLHYGFDSITVTASDALLYRLLLGRYPQIGVMISHVGVDNQFNEVPCSLSATCVGELVSQFPSTLIVSDALDMVAAGHQQDSSELLPLPKRALAAIRAGNELLLFGQGVTVEDLDTVVTELEAAYSADSHLAAKIDAAVQKILERKKIE